jgi:CRP-like cAMP-binding protein
VIDALAASPFRGLPADVLDSLMRDSRKITVAAGALRHREGDADPHLDVVVSGFARAYVSAPHGCTMTVRYCRPGAVLGAVSLYSQPFHMPATIHCLVETRFLALAPARVRRLVVEDPRVAEALLAELSDRVASCIAEIPSGAFASVRQRVARHLLDLASEDQHDARLTAGVSQSDLADAVGKCTRLRDVIEAVAPSSDAVDLVFTGIDHGIQGDVEQDYARGLPLDEALAPDVLLAYGMNGRELEPQHGFPLRLIVPAWYGMASVKWLTRIDVIEHTFSGFQNVVAHRYQNDANDPGEPVPRKRVKSLMAPPGMPEFVTERRVVECRPRPPGRACLVGRRRDRGGGRRGRWSLGSCTAR